MTHTRGNLILPRLKISLDGNPRYPFVKVCQWWSQTSGNASSVTTRKKAPPPISRHLKLAYIYICLRGNRMVIFPVDNQIYFSPVPSSIDSGGSSKLSIVLWGIGSELFFWPLFEVIFVISMLLSPLKNVRQWTLQSKLNFTSFFMQLTCVAAIEISLTSALSFTVWMNLFCFMRQVFLLPLEKVEITWKNLIVWMNWYQGC